MNKKNYLKKLSESNKPYIIYRSKKGFDLYTDFSKKKILTNKNVNNFINQITKNKSKKKNTDLFIGFFGYEILNHLIDVKVKKKNNLKFPKGIFYKPETKIELSNKLYYKSKNKIRSYKFFKININKNTYAKIFNKFKKKN